MRALGELAFQKEQARDTRGTRWIEELRRRSDVRASQLASRARSSRWRSLLTLALGIGANTAMFTLAARNAAQAAAQSRRRSNRLPPAVGAAGASRTNVTVLRSRDRRPARRREVARADRRIFGHDVHDRRRATGSPTHVNAGVVSGNYFDVMGLKPVVGRLTAPSMTARPRAPVTVLSYQFWMAHFGGDPRVVGRTVRSSTGAHDDRRRRAARAALSVSDRCLREHRDEPASPERHDGHVAHASHDGSVRAARAERDGRAGARGDRAHRGEHASRSSGGVRTKASQYGIELSPLREAVNERASLMFWLLDGRRGVRAARSRAPTSRTSRSCAACGASARWSSARRSAPGAGVCVVCCSSRISCWRWSAVRSAFSCRSRRSHARLVRRATHAARLRDPRRRRRAHRRIDDERRSARSGSRSCSRSTAPASVAAALAPAGRRDDARPGPAALSADRSSSRSSPCAWCCSPAPACSSGRSRNWRRSRPGVRIDHVLTVEMPVDLAIERFMAQQAEIIPMFERVRNRVAALPGVDVASLASGVPLREPFIDLDVKAEGRALAAERADPARRATERRPEVFRGGGHSAPRGPLVRGDRRARNGAGGRAQQVVRGKTLWRSESHWPASRVDGRDPEAVACLRRLAHRRRRRRRHEGRWPRPWADGNDVPAARTGADHHRRAGAANAVGSGADAARGGRRDS